MHSLSSLSLVDGRGFSKQKYNNLEKNKVKFIIVFHLEI